MRRQYVTVEVEDTVSVDFLSPANAAGDVNVELKVVGGRLQIVVKASHGDTSSTWDQHEFTVTLPEA